MDEGKFTTKKTVLIVDDEKDLRRVIGRILKGQNLEYLEAENGKEAIDILETSKVDAVICDIKMPVMSGLDCLSISISKGIKIPFIFLTGYSEKQIILQAIRLGAYDFVDKPFKNDELISLVFRALEIGSRIVQIAEEIEKTDLKDEIGKHEKMISLMRLRNYKEKS